MIHNNCCEGFSYVDEQLYNFNEDINLAADNIYGNLEDISQDLKAFYFLIKTLVITSVLGNLKNIKLMVIDHSEMYSYKIVVLSFSDRRLLPQKCEGVKRQF